LAMSLQTPDKIRNLQRKLYLKAKAETDYRFYLLYEKIYREDILRHAYDLMRSNKGAPGVDGVTFGMIEAAGLEEWLSDIRKDLIEKTYRPAPVRRVMIPKPRGNGERPLGIPLYVIERCRLLPSWCLSRSSKRNLIPAPTAIARNGAD
jgi:RNA-directed DNA polymerase